MGKRIVFTGGSGKAGRNAIAYLLSQGHTILNLDVQPLSNPAVHTLKCDITDSGQVFNALTSNYAITEPFPADLPTPPDAIIHFAGMPQPMIVPDNETFRINTMGTYNMIEAGCKLGVRKIIIASSVTVYGVTFAHGDRPFPCFPLEEDSPTDVTDVYALSKVCGERIAASFAERFKEKGIDIYALRIGRVTEPHEYHNDMFNSYIKEPQKWAPHAWCYIDTRDLGQICDLAVNHPGGLGFQAFNTVNDSITNYCESSEEFLKGLYSDVPFTRKMEAREAPVSNRKIRRVLGFKEEHDWRKYYGNKEEMEKFGIKTSGS